MFKINVAVLLSIQRPHKEQVREFVCFHGSTFSTGEIT